MKVFGFPIMAAILFLTACVFESAREKEKGLPGSWLLLTSSTTARIKRMEFRCFGENGGYNAFYMVSRGTITRDTVTGMNRIQGSWTRREDTLEISETAVGMLVDSNGIGFDWPLKMEMRPEVHSSSSRYRISRDSLFVSNLDLDYQHPLAKRQAPHELIKTACPP